MIRVLEGERPVFLLETENTSYILSLSASGHAEHLYYGKKIKVGSAEECNALRERREFEIGNCIAYSKDYPCEMPEDMCLEISAPGHGDIREPFVEAVFADGSRSCDFIYDSFVVDSSASDLSGLPGSYAPEGKAEHLCLELHDKKLSLELHYRVYPDCDVITRSARLINNGNEDIYIERLMSLQLDLPCCGLSVTTFHGAWVREMDKSVITLSAGKFVNESRTGTSSNRANPFFMVHHPSATETSGNVYGFNLVYSGSHYSSIEVSAFGKTRIVSGMQPQGFRCLLKTGESLEAPEAVMTFSSAGFAGESHNMHRFVREHIVRGEWKDRVRPVLLNSWEACYFKINSHTLTSLARIGRRLGIELFVVDDGWFGKRKDDTSSLGDWEPDMKKLHGGLKPLADRIKAMGMGFGLWVEPEMISVDSELYRKDPDWAMEIPGALHSEGRRQRLLDLANPDVQDYVTDKMTEVFSSAEISYVKWDMNRIFTDVFSQYLEPERQGETAYRYVCGLYRILRTLTERFPQILFEGCASGGNRFDLGMLCYFPQIWASDNTDPICRAAIQEGYSYGYPQSCISAHVSASPNHQTLRATPPESRFGAAMFGVLGYELDVRDLRMSRRKAIIAEISLYKKWREVLQFGDFIRLESGNVHKWICVSKDRKKAVGLLLQEMMTPNMQQERFTPKGLDSEMTYRMYSRPVRLDIKQFGNMINIVSPVHIRQDSAVHNLIANAVTLKGESEEMTATGSVFMEAGAALSQGFSGTGFNDKVRVFPDFASRVYFFEAQDDAATETKTAVTET